MGLPGTFDFLIVRIKSAARTLSSKANAIDQRSAVF
jgi:hypothetical protein